MLLVFPASQQGQGPTRQKTPPSCKAAAMPLCASTENVQFSAENREIWASDRH